MSASWAQPWPLPSHWRCLCFPELQEGGRQLPVPGSLLLKQLPADPCSQFLFLAVAEAGLWELHGISWGAHWSRGCHCLVPAPTLPVPSVSHQPCLLPPACSRPHGRNAQDSPTLGCHWVFMCLQFFSLCNSFKNLSAMDIDFTD